MNKLFKTIISLAFIFSASAALAEIPEFVTEIKDHKFSPSEIEIPAGVKFKLIVRNLDKTAEEFESHDLRKEKMVGGGKEITLIIRPLKKGEYEFVGEFHEKTAKGKLIAK